MAHVSAYFGPASSGDQTRWPGHAWLAHVARGPRRPAEAGYAAVDALVALTILSLGLILGLSGLSQARNAGELASETRRAELLITHLMQSGPRRFEAAEGESGGFAWSLETTPIGAERPIALCRRAVALKSASERSFQAVTLESCPEKPVA